MIFILEYYLQQKNTRRLKIGWLKLEDVINELYRIDMFFEIEHQSV